MPIYTRFLPGMGPLDGLVIDALLSRALDNAGGPLSFPEEACDPRWKLPSPGEEKRGEEKRGELRSEELDRFDARLARAFPGPPVPSPARFDLGWPSLA